MYSISVVFFYFFFSSRRRHTRCALVTGVQTCALPIYGHEVSGDLYDLLFGLFLNDELVDLEIQLGNELQREVAGDVLGPALTVRCQLFDQASTILVAESLLVEALGQPGYAKIGRASCRERVCRYV